jgi:hypothetical protein
MARKRRFKSAPWWNIAMLALESQKVIMMRLAKIALGGTGAKAESSLMVSEKVREAVSASQRLMMGSSADSIVRGYRKKVRANVKREDKTQVSIPYGLAKRSHSDFSSTGTSLVWMS